MALDDRGNFPNCPPSLGAHYEQEDFVTSFDTPSMASNSPLAFAVHFTAPFIKVDFLHDVWCPESFAETSTFCDLMLGLYWETFTTLASGMNASMTQYSEHFQNIRDHDNEEKSSLVVITARGRIFKVPRKMKLKELIEAARWPRFEGQQPALKDYSRRTNRKRAIDGLMLKNGAFLALYVVLKDKEDEL